MDETNQVTLNLPNRISFDASRQTDQSRPNCNSKGLSIFYSTDDIPVHSCLLMSTKQKALKYHRAGLRLGLCEKCGFISNTVFDSNLHEYSTQYEETQGFSTHFKTFAERLAQKLVDKYNIHNKTVLEIGCGKGEFLASMCRLGNNRGIGIDPAYVPERNPECTKSQIEFIQDFYSKKYAHIKADVVCCRHTLEHIAPTLDFMQTLRETIGGQTDTLVFFEVPDVLRVLREGAFWDIYYEHCSYFTLGSLARLFRNSEFEIDDLYLDYDDQYLMITAYPAESPTTACLDIEDDMESLSQACKKFRQKCSSCIDYWQSKIHQATEKSQKVVIWGSGSKGVAFLTTLKLSEQIEYVVDINPHKHGKYMPGTGQEIVPPQFLEQYRPDKIIVMNPIYRREIKHDLKRLNIKADLLAV